MELPLGLLVVLDTLLQPIPQSRVADQSSQFSQKSGCAVFLDSMKTVVLKIWQSVYCGALQCVFKDAESLL